MEQKQAILASFSAFDFNGDGLIAGSTLQLLLVRLGMPNDSAKAVIGEMQSCGENMLDYEMFINWCWQAGEQTDCRVSDNLSLNSENFLVVESGMQIVVKGAGRAEANEKYTYLPEFREFLSDTGWCTIHYEDDSKHWFICCRTSWQTEPENPLYVNSSGSDLHGQDALPLRGWATCEDDEDAVDGDPGPTLEAYQDQPAVLRRAPTCWQGGSDLQITVQRLGAQKFDLTAPTSEHITWVKEKITEQWAIPQFEQRLLSDQRICKDSDGLWEYAELLGKPSAKEDVSLVFTCIRIPRFHFDHQLAHDNLCISEDGMCITHGGVLGYQAAFASDVLDKTAKFTVQFELVASKQRSDTFDVHGAEDEQAPPLGYADMYIGLAPDSNRNWAMLECVGIYPDFGFFDGLFGNFDDGYQQKPQIQEIFSNPNQAATIVFCIDMASGLLECRGMDGKTVGEMRIDFEFMQMRLCAMVGWPGQSIRIVPQTL